MEKRLAPGKRLAQQRILGIAPLQYGVEQKGEQVEAEQKRREVPFAMPKVMLQMVAFGLEHVVVFVFTLPPPTTGLGHLRHVLRIQTVIGDNSTVVSSQCEVNINPSVHRRRN